MRGEGLRLWGTESGPSLTPLPACPARQMRTTRGALADAGSKQQSGGGSEQLGVAGEPFTFEAHARAHGVRVATASVSALDKGGVAEAAAFVRKCVPA